MLKNVIIWSIVLILFGCNGNHNSEETNTTDTTVIKSDPATIKKPSIIKNENSFYYGPDTSMLTGLVDTETFYEQPGYGMYPETDARARYFFLNLDKPINVYPKDTSHGNENNEPTEMEITRIQIVYMGDDKDFDEFRNFFHENLHHHVKLSGTFYHAISGHHHTNVLLKLISKQQD